jgi:hypothetical protein
MIPKLKHEFRGASDNLAEFLRLHTIFCLKSNIDQILLSNLVTINCCECNKEMKVAYDKVAAIILCNQCIDEEVPVTKQHISLLQARLADIQKRLMQI